MPFTPDHFLSCREVKAKPWHEAPAGVHVGEGEITVREVRAGRLVTGAVKVAPHEDDYASIVARLEAELERDERERMVAEGDPNNG